MENEQKTVSLTLEEFETFKAIAEKFNVKFDVMHMNNKFMVTAPLEYIIRWGYDEEEDEIKPG